MINGFHPFLKHKWFFSSCNILHYFLTNTLSKHIKQSGNSLFSNSKEQRNNYQPYNKRSSSFSDIEEDHLVCMLVILCIFTLWFCLRERKHSLIRSTLVTGLIGNMVCSSEIKRSYWCMKRNWHKDWTDNSSTRYRTFFSSTTGAGGFAVEGSSGGNPSLRLLSACEDK